jgi:hypothetical protein
LTARTDLDNAFSILDAGIKAHVTALATAQAIVADESYLAGLTTKVLAMADELNGSNPTVVTPVVPAAVVITPPPLPVVTPAVAPLTATTETIVSAILAPEVAPVEAAHVPSVMETMQAAVAAMASKL